MTIFINSLTKHQDVFTRNKRVPVCVSKFMYMYICKYGQREREKDKGEEGEGGREGEINYLKILTGFI